ncbi:MAG: polysaccharide deacetylase family protein, partial [Blastocatellia bacterium]
VVSASPDEFRRQMKFVRQNFDVLSFSELNSLERERQAWPRRALIVTFDDGYLDNYSNAFPVLKEFAVPGTIFLSTGFIGKRTLFWWDLIAYCFKQTELDSAVLEEISLTPFALRDGLERVAAIDSVLRWVKRVPDCVKNRFVAALPKRLGMVLGDERFPRMHLNWDVVREMAASGIEFGSHTVTHPVLANVSLDQLRIEVRESKKEIESHTGRQALTFSYPVGNKGNFTRTSRDEVERAGYRYAVSYVEGLAGKQGYDRLAIPRVHVDADHPAGLFAANLTFPRLMLREQAPYSL